MLNIFASYGIIWSVILCLYIFGWSDLLIDINGGLLLFLITTIIISFFLAYFFRKRFIFVELEENPHKKRNVIKVLLLLYIISFIYSKRIPLINIIMGASLENSTASLPHFNLIITSVSIMYSAYLSYIYANFKDKKTLCEIFIIFAYFILTVQRQNILICLLLFANTLLSKYRLSEHRTREKKHGKVKIVMISALILLILYGFGMMGNYRHGYKVNDSSMIMNLGKINDDYPSFLPKEYAWSYVYVTSPLANLNLNIQRNKPKQSISELVLLSLPEYVSNRLGFYKEAPMLVHHSLTASTAYANVYWAYGYVGMYYLFALYMIVCVLIINMINSKKNKNLVVVLNLLYYFLIFSFFTNTFYYPITSLLLVYSFLLSLNIKKKKSGGEELK